SALFLASLFISPLAGSVPTYATAPALLYVACLMMRELVEVEWEELTEAAPAATTALAMPFTYSIANGLAFVFISYVVLKALTGKWRDIHPAPLIVAVLFIIRFAFFAESDGLARRGQMASPRSRRGVLPARPDACLMKKFFNRGMRSTSPRPKSRTARTGAMSLEKSRFSTSVIMPI